MCDGMMVITHHVCVTMRVIIVYVFTDLSRGGQQKLIHENKHIR